MRIELTFFGLEHRCVSGTLRGRKRLVGIEPTTYSLGSSCSTVELQARVVAEVGLEPTVFVCKLMRLVQSPLCFTPHNSFRRLELNEHNPGYEPGALPVVLRRYGARWKTRTSAMPKHDAFTARCRRRLTNLTKVYGRTFFGGDGGIRTLTERALNAPPLPLGYIPECVREHGLEP